MIIDTQARYKTKSIIHLLSYLGISLTQTRDIKRKRVYENYCIDKEYQMEDETKALKSRQKYFKF